MKKLMLCSAMLVSSVAMADTYRQFQRRPQSVRWKRQLDFFAKPLDNF